jgi:hypothetical protein
LNEKASYVSIDFISLPFSLWFSLLIPRSLLIASALDLNSL